jgi:DNA-binding response OmpR family regulator
MFQIQIHTDGEWWRDITVKKIMLVDDEEDVILSLTASLERNGFQVDGYSDSSLALKDFEKGKYDLVIVDIRMPGIDGFELYEKMEEIDENIKVCFITGFEFNYLALREIYPSLNFGSFIRKPVETEELLTKIQSELGKSK